MAKNFNKDLQYYKFCGYGFLKNLKFFESFLILFYLEKGLNFFEIGALYSIQQITINIFGIPSGIFADAIGRRRTMIYSFIAYIISFIVFYFSNTYPLFIVAILFFAFGDSFRTGTHKAMIFEYIKSKGWTDQKVHYYGHTRSWSQRGSALSSIIAACIVFYSGSYRYIFLFATIPYLLDLILVSSYPKELDGKIQHLDFKVMIKSFKTVMNEFFISFKNIYIFKAISNSAVHGGFYEAVKDYLQPVLKAFALSLPFFLYLDDKQRSAIIIGIFYFFIYIITSYASRKSGVIADKYQKISRTLNITMIIGFCFGALSGLFYNLNLIIIAITLYIGIYIIENLRKPMGEAYITDALDKDILATALSVESQLKSLYAAIFAPIIGFIADRYGIGTGLIVISTIALISIPLYYAKEKRKHL